jgi:hypothetical protein
MNETQAISKLGQLGMSHKVAKYCLAHTAEVMADMNLMARCARIAGHPNCKATAKELWHFVRKGDRK